jgi:hypothetical protein
MEGNMGQQSIPEASSRRILAVFAADNDRPGDVEVLSALKARFLDEDTTLDFASGVEFGIREGWFDPFGQSFKLTDKGAQEARLKVKGKSGRINRSTAP